MLRRWRKRRLENAEANLGDARYRRLRAARFGRQRRTLEWAREIIHLQRRVTRLQRKLGDDQ